MNNEQENILPDIASTDQLEEEKAHVPEFLKEDDWYDAPYEESMLDLDDEMVFPEYTIRFNGAKCGPVTGVMCLAGQSGMGKTQTSTLLMATYLGATIEGIELIWEKQDIKVLYVDTEMEKGNTQLVVARIAQLCGCVVSQLKGKLNVLRLRDEDNHAMIWKKILKAIYEIQPNVVFLDGMIDIIGDFNDNKEASAIVRKVMKLADYYAVCMWTVMHQNPGSTKMVGHEGSFMERKSTMVLQTQKIADDEEKRLYHFEVKNQKQRGEDVIPLKFHMECFQLPNGDINAYPSTSQSIIQQAQEPEPDVAEIMAKLITTKDGITTRDLLLGIKHEMRIGTSKAQQVIWDAEKDGLITRDDRKSYHLGSKDDTIQLTTLDEGDVPN